MANGGGRQEGSEGEHGDTLSDVGASDSLCAVPMASPAVLPRLPARMRKDKQELDCVSLGTSSGASTVVGNVHSAVPRPETVSLSRPRCAG